MRKNFIRGCAVICAFVLTFLLCEKVLMLKSEDGIEQMQSYYLQEKDTVDVLLVGSSHIYCNVNTGVLWDTYGISAYDLGGAEQPYWNSYYFIKEALKTQRPKAIVMSVTIPGIRFDDYQSEAWLMTNLYGMHWNRNRIENNEVSTLPESFWRLLIPMNTIHSRYNDLDKDDFIDRNHDISYKGFDLRSTVTPCIRPDISNVTDMTPLTDKQEVFYRKIIELSIEENIPLLLVSVPYVVSEEAQKIYNYEFAIASEYGVDYIDFNKCYDDMGLDFATDMAEELHLNINGSEKFTKYLGKCLLERYDIPDHRGDALYSSWDENALIERQEASAATLSTISNISEYLETVNTKNYISIIDFDGMESLPAATADSLAKMGINVNQIENGYVAITSGGKSLFESKEEEFTAFIDEKDNKILAKREDDSTKYYIDTTELKNPWGKVCIIVYDRILDRVVGFESYDPASDTFIKFE